MVIIFFVGLLFQHTLSLHSALSSLEPAYSITSHSQSTIYSSLLAPEKSNQPASAMRSVLFLTSCLAATSAAAPMFGDLYHFSDEMAEFLGRVGKRISDAGNVFDQSLSCDASSIQLPSFASSLPAPTDQKPLYVALGRGTQVSSLHAQL